MKVNTKLLEEAMKQREWTQKNLADVSGVTRQTINCILHGKTCSEETYKKIVAALYISPLNNSDEKAKRTLLEVVEAGEELRWE